MPTSRTKAVEYALKEFVASLVPTCANSRSERPAIWRAALDVRAADLLAARHVPGGRRHRHAALDQARQVVDLARVVAAVGHRHHATGAAAWSMP